MTLTEILVVVAVMAILLGISVPTAQHLMDSFESSTGVRYLINAALSNARAIAVRNQAYAGVRFQTAAGGNTYMIFIVHDPDATGYANGFRAVMGRQPMKLPEGVTVNDCFVVFSPAGKLTTHSVNMNGSGGTSMRQITISKEGKYNSGTESSNEYISPYTGELVMEYREKSL